MGKFLLTDDGIAVESVEAHYSVATVAQLLEVSDQWVYDRINDGTFSTVVELGYGRAKQRIAASVIQRFLDERTHRREQIDAA